MRPVYDSVVYRTNDGGMTWQATGGLGGAFECLCLLKAQDGTIYAGTTPNGDVFKYIPTAVQEHEAGTPASIMLNVYPNPVRDIIPVQFDLPVKAEASLVVYDVSGNKIAPLMQGSRNTGSYWIGWDLCASSGTKVPTGVYFVRMETRNLSATKKVIVLGKLIFSLNQY